MLLPCDRCLVGVKYIPLWCFIFATIFKVAFFFGGVGRCVTQFVFGNWVVAMSFVQVRVPFVAQFVFYALFVFGHANVTIGCIIVVGLIVWGLFTSLQCFGTIVCSSFFGLGQTLLWVC